MMRFRRSTVRIRDRIVVMIGNAIVTWLVLCAVMIWAVERRQDADHWVEQTEQTLRHLSEFSEMILQGESTLRGYFLTEDKSFLDSYRLVRDSYRDKYDDLVTLMSQNPGHKCDLAGLSDLADKKISLGAEALARAQASDMGGAIALVRIGQMREIMTEFQAKRRECANEGFQLLSERRAKAEIEARNVAMTVALGGLISITVLISVAWRAINQIETPLDSLMRGIKLFGQGDLTARVEVSSRDELGQVANSFNVMAEQLQENRAELERSNRELDQFAYVASHDLKAPLRGIRSLAEWISEDVKGSAGGDTMENLALLQNRVERLDLLLDSLLQYSRVGRSGDKPEMVDTCHLVGDIAGYLAPKQGFTIYCADGMPALFTYKAPLELVFRNLISNALKHHDRPEGRVTVSGVWRGKLAEFRVRDDGPGIPPEFHDKVFQMFQTLKPRDQVEGSGMGLAIVKKTVESQGGTVRIESEPGERGTTFVFTWCPAKK
jgi:signal transduction histidine kinase